MEIIVRCYRIQQFYPLFGAGSMREMVLKVDRIIKDMMSIREQFYKY
ncbi:hypothetical protein R9X47_11055 [Wukongibacter baidiensis]